MWVQFFINALISVRKDWQASLQQISNLYSIVPHNAKATRKYYICVLHNFHSVITVTVSVVITLPVFWMGMKMHFKISSTQWQHFATTAFKCPKINPSSFSLDYRAAAFTSFPFNHWLPMLVHENIYLWGYLNLNCHIFIPGNLMHCLCHFALTNLLKSCSVYQCNMW